MTSTYKIVAYVKHFIHVFLRWVGSILRQFGDHISDVGSHAKLEAEQVTNDGLIAAS